MFSILNLGSIQISDLIVANLFMHSLPGMILLYLAAPFCIPKVFLHEIMIYIQECRIGDDNEHALEVDDTYTGNVVLNSNSRIVSMMSFNNFGFVSVFTATDDNLVHKVIYLCICLLFNYSWL